LSAAAAPNDRDRVPVILSAAMESSTYHVQADWDPDANVWVATSDDVPGLATEAATIEELTARLRTLIPELLEANGLLPAHVPSDRLAFELTSHRQELVTLAS
jgi:predicted RNase H-like HicB family nuclease